MLALLPFLLAAAPAPASDLAGSWDLDVDGTTIFRLEIADTSEGIKADWARPDHFGTDGDTFSELKGPVTHHPGRFVRRVGTDVEIDFTQPSAGSGLEVLRLHSVDADHLEASFQGAGTPPFAFVRTRHPAPMGPWDPERSYVAAVERPSNPEMAAIFKADQDDRKGNPSKIDWSVVGPADVKRRKRTQDLLDAGQLQSAQDYFGAAFVFQHGAQPDDFLKAHLLAMVAVARGRPDALWIASASLDRYLQNIGKPQVLGTQFTMPADAPVNQEPYNRALMSDAMRGALKVPTLAEQEKQRQQYQALSDAAKAAPNSPLPAKP